MTERLIPQVNLLKAEFRPRRVSFSIRHAGLALATTLVLIAIHGSWLLYQKSENSEQAELAKSNEQLASTIYEKKKSEYAANAIDSDIDTQIEQLDKRVKDKTQVRNNVQHALNAASGAYSPYLRALAAHYRPEAWLENVFLSGNEKLLLEGYTIKPIDLMNYVDRLSSDKLFQGRQFDIFSLKKQEYLPPQERIALEQQAAQQQNGLVRPPATTNTSNDKPKEEFFSFKMSTGIQPQIEQPQNSPAGALSNVPVISNALAGANQ